MSPEKPVTSGHPAPEDKILRFFQSPFFLSLTIGIPFCIYKFIFGSLAIRYGTEGEQVTVVFGLLIIMWAAIDLTMNIARACLDFFGRSNALEYCIIAEIGRYFHAPRTFLAFDTLLTFSIICAMLWSGWITRLTPFEAFLWYAATTLNLISLSLVIMYDEALRAHRTAIEKNTRR